MEAKASERGSGATTHLGVHTLGYFWLLLEGLLATAVMQWFPSG